MESGTTIPNEVIDALAGRHISGTELQLVLVLAKLTWGRGREHAQVTLGRLADAMNSGRTTVSRAVARLEEGGVVTKELVPGHPGGSLYAINRDVARWRLRPKEPEVRIQVLRRDGYTCSYCGVTDHDRMTVDHVIPKSAGGPDEPSNMTAACMPCNLRKSSVGTEAFFRERPPARAWVKELLERLTPSAAGGGGGPQGRGGRGREEGGLAEGLTPGGGPEIDIPEMEAKSLPSADEARPLVMAGAFVCPIFETPCGERRGPLPPHRAVF